MMKGAVSIGYSFSGNMRLLAALPRKFLLASCGLLLVCSLADAKSPSTPASTKAKTQKTPKKSRKKTASWRRGQQKIDPQRARAIQDALVREHYLDGQASGTWDANSQRAMERYQADNGWQSKVVPDSRALIKLGLGPGHEHLLNPESAMTRQTQAGAAHSSSTSSPAVNPAARDAGNQPQQ